MARVRVWLLTCQRVSGDTPVLLPGRGWKGAEAGSRGRWQPKDRPPQALASARGSRSVHLSVFKKERATRPATSHRRAGPGRTAVRLLAWGFGPPSPVPLPEEGSSAELRELCRLGGPAPPRRQVVSRPRVPSWPRWWQRQGAGAARGGGGALRGARPWHLALGALPPSCPASRGASRCVSSLHGALRCPGCPHSPHERRPGPRTACQTRRGLRGTPLSERPPC